ncbi:bestrophin family protein [Chitinasiproducens palmae]|uniref:Putative membrane protein n=1 Tax=Chitinasiproducens palmae TaxID=1770053 RepID=A0A1H2PWV2_9BURK|nr:bestrophin family ion channel [Chitinasiproducens palmae]SDV51039.1 putative membrane protein [Chitinasiproducens palmae]
MIVRPRLNWFRMLFVWHGSVVGNILPPLGFILLISLAATLGRQRYEALHLHLNPVPFSLIGVALAIFVSFRNTASYERFWEARKQWGQLLNHSRDLVRLASVLPGLAYGDPALQRFVANLIAFTHALKHQLRRTDPADEMRRLLGQPASDALLARHYRPAHLLRVLNADLMAWHREGRLSDMFAVSVQRHLDGLSEILGSCERISSTPIPYAYHVLLHRTVYFYCALLPFGLVDSIGWATPVISVFIAYTFMALDAIASQLEDPFGNEPNDLALAALATNIERTVLETVDAPDLPPLPEVGHGYHLN